MQRNYDRPIIMAPSHDKILIASNDDLLSQSLKALLQEEGYEVVNTLRGMEALELLSRNVFGIVLTDVSFPDIAGIELINQMRNQDILTPTIIISGEVPAASVVEAMKCGAYDYLTRPVEPSHLKTVIAEALRDHRTMRKRVARRRGQNSGRYENILGQSSEMREIYQRIGAVADSTANVIITGESGTGKELVARAIHQKSSRAAGPFVAVNCSAFPMEILENELFGHEEGAFTGALKEKPGCFELAHTGTLFLDEVCQMPLETQAKILRALEERRFRRLGGKAEIAVDVRVISASNQKLEEAVAQEKLREDIYYRLSVVEIELPPLRERDGDLPLLMHEFLKMFAQKNAKEIEDFSPPAREVLSRYHWPGNVRELKNTIERAVVLCDSSIIKVKDLPKRLLNPNGEHYDVMIPIGSTLESAERELILQTLDFVKNNKTRAAKILGISLKTLHNKLNLYKAENYY